MKWEIRDDKALGAKTTVVDAGSPKQAGYEYISKKFKSFKQIRVLGSFEGLWRFEIYCGWQNYIYEHYRISEVKK